MRHIVFFLFTMCVPLTTVFAQTDNVPSTPYRSYVVQLDDELKRALLPEHVLNCDTVFFTVSRSPRWELHAYLLYVHVNHRQYVIWWDNAISVTDSDIAFLDDRGRITLLVRRK